MQYLVATLSEGEPEWCARKCALDARADQVNRAKSHRSDRVYTVRLEQDGEVTHSYWAASRRARDRFETATAIVDVAPAGVALPVSA